MWEVETTCPLQGLLIPKRAARVQPPLVSEAAEEDEGEDAVEGDAGSANPIEKAVLQLSKIEGHLSKALLASHSKSAALCSLRRMLLQRPRKIGLRPVWPLALRLQRAGGWSKG